MAGAKQKLNQKHLEVLAFVPEKGRTRISVKQLMLKLGLELDGKTGKAKERQVQRLLETLEDNGYVVTDGGNPGGWSQTNKARDILQIPAMTNVHALSVHLAEQTIKQILPTELIPQLTPYFELARKHLDKGQTKSPLLNWPHRVRTVTPGMPLIAPKILPQTREGVTSALMHGKQIEFDYQHQDSRGKKASRGHPLALIQNGNTQYIVMRFFEYDRAVLAAMHRISNVKVLEAASKAPLGFDLDNYLDSGVMGFGYDGKPVKIVLDFIGYAGKHLLESKLSVDQTVEQFGDEADARLRVKATVMNTCQLRWWIRQFGAEVEVLSPEWLREEMAEQCRLTAKLYKAPKEKAKK